jgi:hypothetical protein
MQNNIIIRAIINTCVLSFLCGLTIFLVFNFYPNTQLDEDIISSFVEIARYNLNPEPQEHQSYHFSLILIALFGVYIISTYPLLGKIKPNKFLQLASSVVLFCIISLFVYYFLLQPGDIYSAVYINFFRKYKLYVWVSVMLASVASAIYLLRKEMISTPKAYKNSIFIYVLTLLPTFISNFCNYNISKASLHPHLCDGHTDAVLYSVVQVFYGKTALVDLPTQYGLYSEFLLPIFKIIGLSIFSFHIVMTTLQFLAQAIILFVVWRIVKSVHVYLLFTVAFILGSGIFVTWILESGHAGPYFGYWPIRFIFPSLACLLVHTFVNHTPRKKSFLLGLFCGLAILWNIDSGVAIFFAFFVYLALVSLFETDESLFKSISVWRKAAFTNSIFILGVTVSIATFLIWLMIKSGSLINPDYIGTYQNIFYVSGFFMIPLPREGSPWHAYVVLIFLSFNLFFSIKQRSKISNYSTLHLLLFVSLLAAGMFSYYIGRSHPLVFRTQIWLCIFLVTLLANLKPFYKSFENYVFKLGFLFLISLYGLYSTAAIIHKFPKMVILTKVHYEGLLNSHAKNGISPIRKFIRQNMRDNYPITLSTAICEAHILTTVGTNNAIKGPGYIETVLQRDIDYKNEQLINSPIMDLFVYGKPNIPPEVLKEYYLYKSTPTCPCKYYRKIDKLG